MNLVFEEYTANCVALRDLDLENHCHRFEQFGSSIRRSIQRQLEVLRFIDVQGEPPKWPTAGETFGSFHVLEELGLGAIARVYLCLEDEVGNRPVVVKATPLPSFEASILGKLNHENIIPIYSTGFVEERGLNYLCMPYRGRSTLADLVDMAFQDGCPRQDTWIEIAASRWTTDENWFPKRDRRRLLGRFHFATYVDGVLKLARQIADALDHAHQQKIVHGDLKPSNVLLTPDGKPLLLDFNLSQDDSSQHRTCGGTLPYMPPEHLQAVAGKMAPLNSSNLEVPADIYSFGALLYELLAGVTPVHELGRADDPSTMAKLLLAKIEEGVPAIRQYNRFVGARLESIVMRCLNYDQRKRPATMAEVKQALQKERRPWVAAYRQAHIRPVLFSAAVAVPLAILSGTVTYRAMQAPRYLASYEEGLRQASIGDSDKAVAYFTSAERYNPSFTPARFQLGRMRIAQGELDLALNEFGPLARGEQDIHSMVYVGYCFNLKRSPVAAIPWYERAIQRGAASAAVYNNLGASYLETSTNLSSSEKLNRSEFYLLKALELGESSPTIQLNIVRHAMAKSKFDSSYNPFVVWRHAQSIIAAFPNDEFVEFRVALWYQAVRRCELGKRDLNSNGGNHPSDAESSARKRFEIIYSRVSSRNQDRELVFAPSSDLSTLGVQRCFLEPVSLP